MKLIKRSVLVLASLAFLSACDSSSSSSDPAPEANPTPTEGGETTELPEELSLETQLVRGIQRGDLESIKTLLSENVALSESLNIAIVDVESEKGLTPLMIAARWGRFEISQYLIEMGADRYQADANGFGAAYYAKINGFTLLSRYIEQNLEGVDLELELYNAARKGIVEDIRFFLIVGADINFAGSNGTILMAAIVSQRPEAVKLLLDKGIDANVKVTVRGRELTALEYAKLIGNVNPEIIKLLESASQS